MANDDLLLYGVLGYLGYTWYKNRNGVNEYRDEEEANGGEQEPDYSSGGGIPDTLTGTLSLPESRQHPVVKAMPKKATSIQDTEAFNYLAFPYIPGSGAPLAAQRDGDGYLEYGVGSSMHTT